MDNIERENEIVIGLHSIAEALKNPVRTNLKLYTSQESLDELKKNNEVAQRLTNITVKMLPPQRVQEEGQKIYQKNRCEYQRIPSNIFLLASPTPVHEINWLYQKIESSETLKILCLDNVTDIHNIAAILRTMAFYAADVLVMAQKKSGINLTPTATRIASGALEHVDLVACSNLSKLIGRLEEKGVLCYGLSEHSTEQSYAPSQKICLIMGAEDRGISHAVQRKLSNMVAIPALGKIKSLNVSVASALAMEKFFRAP